MISARSNPPRSVQRGYLGQVVTIGLLASLIAGIVLSTTITVIYRKSVMEAEDRLELARATDILSDAVAPMASSSHTTHASMETLAMTVSHIRMLIPAVRGVHIMFPNGTQMFGAGDGRSTESVPLVSHAGKILATVGLSVADRKPLDGATVTFIIAISLAALFVTALPQIVLARRAISILIDQRTRAERAYVLTLISLSGTLELRDPYTAHHSQRVAAYAEGAALCMRLTEDQVKVVREGALLHDLGKVGVPDAVLLKNGPLGKHERGIIERHPTVGSSVLDGHEAFAEVRACVLHHHEHFDGSGYPEGLRGSAIPLSARIIAVADSYDAMTTDRPYRKALDHDTAIQRLRAGTGTQWDGVCVQALISSLSKVPVLEVT